MNIISWSDDVEDSVCGEDSREEFGDKFEDAKSNDDDKSSGCVSGSDQSSTITRNFQSGFRLGSTVLNKSDRSRNYSRYQSERDPNIESQFRETELLHLLSASGFPMTQVNGQRKLGPPPGWSKPPPDPSCEVFVGKIPRTLYEHEIYPIFQKIGQVYEIRLMMDFSGTNRGYCFVMFSKFEYAQRAVRELNNYEIRPGRRIGVVASINNCRLSIGQLPSDIDSELVIKKFYETTDEVSKVAVYKNINGQVRCALVSYKTHRGAAMARRRLLPDRGNLFANVEVSIDWAHPEMAINNGVEESGVQDENGELQITSVTISQCPKRNGWQKKNRQDFLDKSIKNYLQEKSSIQCKSEISRSKSFPRGNSFSSRRRGGRNLFHQKKHLNHAFREKPFKRENNNSHNRQNHSRSFTIFPKETSENLRRDINGNLTKSKNTQKNPSDFYEPENKIAQQFNPLAKVFVPNNAFNLFAQYSLTNEKNSENAVSPNNYDLLQTANFLRGSVSNFFRTFDPRSNNDVKNNPTNPHNDNGKSANFGEFGKWNSTENFVPKKQIDNEVIGAFEKFRIDAKYDPHKNFRNSSEKEKRLNNPPRVLNQITNWNGNHEIQRRFQDYDKKSMNSSIKENIPNYVMQNCCQGCIQRQLQFSAGNPGLYQQPNDILANQQTNDIFGNQSFSVDRGINIPLPQSYFKTPSLGDAYHAILPQIYTSNNQNAYRPRPILNRLAGRAENQ